MDTIGKEVAKEYWLEKMKLGEVLVGKPTSQIHEVLHSRHTAKQNAITAALEDMKSSAVESDNGTWYFGSVSTGGFIRGDLTAHIHFGNVDMTFNGTCWSGPQAIAGGGGGIWSMIPSDGQSMDFSFGAAASGGGEIQVYWSVNGVVVGQLIAAVGGAAISGGSGSGKWTKD